MRFATAHVDCAETNGWKNGCIQARSDCVHVQYYIVKLLSRWPPHLPSTKNMDMKMIDTLRSVFPVVDDCAEPDGTVLASKLPSRGQKVAQDWSIVWPGLTELSDLLLGDDEDMHRRLWVNVAEREAHIILVP